MNKSFAEKDFLMHTLVQTAEVEPQLNLTPFLHYIYDHSYILKNHRRQIDAILIMSQEFHKAFAKILLEL